jgi:beta-galactosidase
MSTSTEYRAHGQWRRVLASMAIGALAMASAGTAFAQTPDPTEVRRTLPLMENWRFVADDDLSEEDALEGGGEGWETVDLPHTWNAEDAASLHALEPYKRGIGWYRLEFATPTAGARHWLEFGAASLVADVWLNGRKLGRHRGGFTAFRFDVTDALAEGGGNVLLVKVNNSEPEDADDVTAIDPLGGDYNRSGGLYRHVSLISTADPVHFDLADLGGPGVYATTTAIADGDASVNVRAKLKSDADRAADYVVRAALLEADGRVAQQAQRTVPLPAGGSLEVAQDLVVREARLWQGVADPYQYRLVTELQRPDGAVLDRVVQDFGIRQMRFDPDEGFFLNGEHVRLRGVAMHQDYLRKGWAVSRDDIDESFALIKEIGANAVRLGHYTFSQYALERASELGLIAWSEKPSGIRTTVEECSTTDPPDAYVANAGQQLQEMIRQHYNRATVALWSIGNETEAGQSGCDEQYDNVTPYLKQLHALAKREDPGRPTANAEFTQGIAGGTGIFGDVSFTTAGITDVLGTNRYYLWYNLDFDEFGRLLDLIHTRFPDQPLGVTEYGAGAAVSHHTDSPRGGPPEARGGRKGEVAYQPEEYASYVHERDYRLLSSKPYLWGSFVWNMFDFGSDHRNEGDVQGVNTKGLVTFDRKTRKDPFYFYKANWSSEPVTYITGRRYVDRAYAVTDVKVYSNADSVRLSVNGAPVGTMPADRCEQRTCVFERIRLGPGANAVTAVGDHGGKSVTDTVVWSLTTSDVNIAAGRLATGYVSSQGARFGSDHFFTGGTGIYVIEPGEEARGGTPEDIRGTDDPLLFKYLRGGDFGYDIPLADGDYEVTLGFLETDRNTAVGDRVFDVAANGETKLDDFDVLEAAGDHRTAVARTFTATVSDGHLRLDFIPVRGEAVVSNLMIRRLHLPASADAQGAE